LNRPILLKIFVFDLETDRRPLVQPLLDELELQATASEPFERVGITGAVRAQGFYPYEAGMRVSDLLRAGANLNQTANIFSAELSRFELINETARKTINLEINPADVLAGNLDADILLMPNDVLRIKGARELRPQLSVVIEGEVRFPGRYAFNPGDTLVSIIERAGGLTDIAFPQGSILLREDLKEREQQQIDFLIDRLESDLAAAAVEAGVQSRDVSQAQSAGRGLLAQLQGTEPVGRLVIDLPGMLQAPDDPEFVVLVKQDDRLVVPPLTQDVTVLGQVQFPTSHLHRSALRRDDYIDRSGGLNQNAANKQIYIVRANGSVSAASGSRWFGSGGNAKVYPGDTIVVPLNTRPISPLSLWTDVTTVVYNIAIAVAAINGLN
jgi:protein involved in polysaccharide export with SLBB domain